MLIMKQSMWFQFQELLGPLFYWNSHPHPLQAHWELFPAAYPLQNRLRLKVAALPRKPWEVIPSSPATHRGSHCQADMGVKKPSPLFSQRVSSVCVMLRPLWTRPHLSWLFLPPGPSTCSLAGLSWSDSYKKWNVPSLSFPASNCASRKLHVSQLK